MSPVAASTTTEGLDQYLKLRQARPRLLPHSFCAPAVGSFESLLKGD
jgi:hypothetical protein